MNEYRRMWTHFAENCFKRPENSRQFQHFCLRLSTFRSEAKAKVLSGHPTRFQMSELQSNVVSVPFLTGKCPQSILLPVYLIIVASFFRSWRMVVRRFHEEFEGAVTRSTIRVLFRARKCISDLVFSKIGKLPKRRFCQETWILFAGTYFLAERSRLSFHSSITLIYPEVSKPLGAWKVSEIRFQKMFSKIKILLPVVPATIHTLQMSRNHLGKQFENRENRTVYATSKFSISWQLLCVGVG